jgi:hypothetical protein
MSTKDAYANANVSGGGKGDCCWLEVAYVVSGIIEAQRASPRYRRDARTH